MTSNDAQTRVLLVDDDPMVVSGLRSILSSAADIDVVATASTGEEALHQVTLHFPDLVLMDIQMPGMGGIEATRRLINSARAPKVVALTSFDTDDHLIRALDAGADGYILKDIPPTELPIAIRKVMGGEPFFSPQTLRRLITQSKDNDARRRQQEAASLIGALTPREQEIVGLVAQGKSNPEIAAATYLGVATVKTHLNKAMFRLGTDNRIQAAILYDRATM